MKSALFFSTAVIALATAPANVVDATAEAHLRIHVGAAHARQAKSSSEFCWRDSDPRGVGTVPQKCADGKDRIGLLCYPKCPAGMKRFGFDCHSVCPPGFADQGLFCRLTEYGRGAGYPWKFGDGFNDSGMYRRCEADQGRGNCEKNGLIVYPKCKPGYSAFGCCICRPSRPNCGALGMGGQLDLSCAKKIIIGSPSIGECNADQDRDAGLCYRKCKPNFKGIGPVCWDQAPPGWVQCGMGAAKDTSTCVSIIVDQVMSVGELALNIATLGSSSAATATAKADPTKLQKLQKAWDAIKNNPAVKEATEVYDTASKAQTGYESIDQLYNAKTEADYIRLAAMIASILDPTGIAGVIAAYSYDKCSNVVANSS